MTTDKNTGTKKSSKTASRQVNFEATLDELESLVEKMETGELSLEASLEAFERGVKLTRECQGALKRAELRIQTLNQENEDIVLVDEPES